MAEQPRNCHRQRNVERRRERKGQIGSKRSGQKVKAYTKIIISIENIKLIFRKRIFLIIQDILFHSHDSVEAKGK